MDDRKGTVTISLKIKYGEEYTLGNGYNHNGEEILVEELAKFVTKAVYISDMEPKEFLSELARRMVG